MLEQSAFLRPLGAPAPEFSCLVARVGFAARLVMLMSLLILFGAFLETVGHDSIVPPARQA